MEQSGFAHIDPSRVPDTRPDRSQLDGRRRAVEQWLAQLPVADPDVTGRRLLEKLDNAATCGMKPGARLDLLARLEGMVTYVTDSLRKRYHLQPLPLPSRSARAVRLLLQLAEAMTRGYRLVLITDPGGLFGLGRRHRAQAGAGICRHAGVALLECWHLYRRPPGGVWRILHTAWHEAAAVRAHERRVKGPAGRTSVDSLYKQLLLTAAANPWQMPRGEVQSVFTALQGLARHALLVAGDSSRAADAVFRLDPAEDREPQPVTAKPREHRGGDVLLVTADVVRILEQRLQSTSRGRSRADDAPGREPERIRFLIQALGEPPERGEEREPATGSPDLVFGLNRIHRLLEAELADDEKQLSPGSGRTGTELQEPAGIDEDSWDLLPGMDEEAEHLVASPVAPFRGGDRAEIEADQESGWETVNVSSGGYCLQKTSGGETRARVGELVLLQGQRQVGREVRAIGMVRWVRRDGATGMRIGVQLLGRSPRPVDAETLDPQPGGADRQACLLLTEPDRRDEPDSLLFPPIDLPGDGRIRLQQGSAGHAVEVTGEGASSPAFRQVRLRAVTDDEGT